MRIPPLAVPSARLEHVVTSKPPGPQDRFVPSAPLGDVARTLFAPVRPLWVHRPALEFDPTTQRFTWRDGDLRHTVDAEGGRLEVAGHASSLPGSELVVPGADGSVSLWRVPPPKRTVEARPLPTIEEGSGWIRTGDVLLPCA